MNRVDVAEGVEGDTLPWTRRHPSVRRWALVAAGVAIWWALYSWNRPFWNTIVYDVAGLDSDSRLGESIHFFFYDVTKIALLLTGVIFVVTVLRSFM